METKKNKLVALKGLPASGKSTYAKSLVEQGWIRTNKDTIRKELFPEYKQRRDEKKVVKERNSQVIAGLKKGKNVVVDDTNLNPVHIKELKNIAKQYNAEFEVNDSFLDVPLAVCIERDKYREASVGESVIRGMHADYVKKKFNADEFDPSLPFCVISDIDGTLAHMNGKRKPYDWHKVGLDDLDYGVAHVLDGVDEIGLAKIFVFSGRDEVCRPETTKWLEQQCIPYAELYMRRSDHKDAKGNNVADTIVKAEMYEKYIKGKYNVLFILDDRPQVCRQWRDVYGLRVMQLGDPHYEF